MIHSLDLTHKRTPDDLHSSAEEAVEYEAFYEDGLVLEHHFENYSEAEQFFATAKKACDIGSGGGASTLYISRKCPAADITTVDSRREPFDEILKVIGARYKGHIMSTATEFLRDTSEKFDIIFLIKVPHILSSDDCEHLADCVQGGGYVVQMSDEALPPAAMVDYFIPVSIIDGHQMKVIDILWKKR